MPDHLLSYVVRGAFLSFLLTLLYAIFRWTLADARAREKPGWPLAALMTGVPILGFLARIAFPSLLPMSVSAGIMLGVPLLVWVVWLLVRPAARQQSSDAILCGRDGAASRWILILSLTATGYSVGVAWLTQFVMYPMYLSVPPDGFPAYYAHFLRAIVVPVIVALSLTWVLSVLVVLNRPTAIPAWAPWTAVLLALIGFIASQALEVPYNQQLTKYGYDAAAIHAKISKNWFRLIPWTLQSALLVWMTNVTLREKSLSGGER